MEMNQNRLSKLENHFQSQQIAIFCGAGISLDPPAGLPDWHNLRDYTLSAIAKKNIFLQSYLAQLTEIDMIAIPGKKGLTPEFVASVILENSDKYFECFRCLDNGRPNHNHFYLAQLAKKGVLRYIITTNFDTFIEQALQEQNIAFDVYKSNKDFAKFALDNTKVHVLKLHGCLCEPETITATIEQESKGLSIVKANVLDTLLKQYYFLFWGYSGADLKISLNYLRLVSMEKHAKGFMWNFHESKNQEINSNVQKLADLYKDKANIIHNQLPHAFKAVIDEEVKTTEYSFQEQQSLWEQRNKELQQNLTEWSDEHLNSIQTINIFAKLLKYSGQIESAKNCYEHLLKIACPSENYKVICEAYEQIGYIYKLHGKYGLAIHNFNNAKNTASKNNDNERLVIYLSSLAGVYRIQRQFKRALALYLEAEKISRDNNDLKGLAFTLNKIGIDHRSQRNEVDALLCFREAEKIAREIGEQQGLAINLDNIGKIYRNQKKFDEALQYFNEAKRITESLGDKQGLGIRLSSIASVYEKQRLYPKAIGFYKQALEIASDLGDLNGLMLQTQNIAHILEKQNNIKDALSYYEEALKYAAQLEHRSNISRITKVIGYCKKKL